ncbi:MAG: M48 family metalloprotease [Albidovulum sp.]
MKRVAILGVLTLAACVELGPVTSAPDPTVAVTPVADAGPALDAATAARNFSIVVARMEPLAEAECRARLRDQNCDFQIVIDTTAGAPSNAYQTRDKAGRPIIAFTSALISDARNVDELAFVMGHEAAHHILSHIPRQQQTALTGALLSGVAAAVLGADQSTIEKAQNIGGTVGARTYSKDFELEADELGTVLAFRAGYDPERGAAFFARIPDPGDRFLGTHPPNAQRIAIVRQTLAQLR